MSPSMCSTEALIIVLMKLYNIYIFIMYSTVYNKKMHLLFY